MQRLRKLGHCFVHAIFLHKHRSQIIVQIRTLRVQLNRYAQLGDCLWQIAPESQYSSECPVCFRIFRPQAHCVPGLRFSFGEVGLLQKRVGQIQVGLREIRT